MKRIFPLLLFAAILALAFWGWFSLFPGPEDIVQRHLIKLARLVSFEPNQGNISRVADIQRLGLLFNEKVEITIDVPGVERHTFTEREELTSGAMAARSTVSSLKVKFFDIGVMLEPDKQSAIADLTMEARIGNQKDRIIQELKFHFIKKEKDWLITRIETVKSLKSPSSD